MPLKLSKPIEHIVDFDEVRLFEHKTLGLVLELCRGSEAMITFYPDVCPGETWSLTGLKGQVDVLFDTADGHRRARWRSDSSPEISEQERGSMRGRNTIMINQATMKMAMEFWLKSLYVPGIAKNIKVTNVQETSSPGPGEFEVRIDCPEDPANEE